MECYQYLTEDNLSGNLTDQVIAHPGTGKPTNITLSEGRFSHDVM